MSPLPVLSGLDLPLVVVIVAFFMIFFGGAMYLAIRLGWEERLSEWRARRSRT